MGFNPIDVVNVISNLLGEKDTSQKTAELMTELEYAHIRDLIPFKYYDSDSGLFINDNSIGFIIETQPLIGANEQLVESFNRILQSNIPREHYLQVSLLGSKAIKNIVDFGLKDFEWKGEFANECNRVTRNYYLSAAEDTFPNRANHPLTLREYRLFFSYTMPVKSFNDTYIIKVKDVRRSFISALNSNGMYSEIATVESVCGLLREIINFQYDKLTEYERSYLDDKDIANQVVNPSTSYLVKPSHILISSIDEQGETHNTRSVSFHLSENPGEHFLWQNGNIISDLLQVERGITSPFIFTMILNTEEQTSSTNEANRKFFDLEKKANGGFSRFIPSVKREFQEWESLRNSLLNGQSSLSNYFVGIRIFCKDDDDVMMYESEKVLKAFEGQGLKVIRSDFMQLRDWFASIPFVIANNVKYWNDFKKTGSILRAETFQAVNLLPLIGDNKLSRAGILLPSYRNQVAFLDLFDENLPTTNFNWYMSATSGAGKSVMAQAIVNQVLDTHGIVSIFDIGDSYKAFCSSRGGQYINGSTLRFNPFANLTNIEEQAERVRDQLCILASPNGLLDDVHQSLILRAITEQFPEHKQGMRIDHIVEYLKKHKQEVRDSERIGGRIDEITHLLQKYTTKGIYGKYFNSDEPTLSPDMQFVVTELGDLRQTGDLLMAVLFTLMIWVESTMYMTPRNIRKLNLIDEGWKLLSASSNKVTQFIEEGYRTARRHNGSFGTVTQAVSDKNLSTAALAAYNNSSFKFTLMQDAKSFASFVKEEPNIYSDLEIELIKKFPAARNVGYSSLLLNMGGVSSFHRLLLDPLRNALFSSRGEDFTYREKRFAEGASIQQIVMEMAQKADPELMEKLLNKQY